VRSEQTTRRGAKTATFHEEARKVEAALGVALVAARIERGDLVEAKQYQVVRGVWTEVDEKTEERHF
jgi:hypothetical protein